MKKIILLILISLFIKSNTAQEPYWKITHIGWGTQLVQKGDTLVTIGTGADENYLAGFQLNKYLLYGTLISQWYFKHDSTLFDLATTGINSNMSLTEMQNGDYLWGGLCGWVYDSIPGAGTIKREQGLSPMKSISTEKDVLQRTNAVVFRLNKDLDSIKSVKVFSPFYFYSSIEMIYEKHPDTLLVLLKENIDGPVLYPRLIETDSLFNIRWDRKLYLQNGYLHPQSFIALPDGGYFLLFHLEPDMTSSVHYNDCKQVLVKISSTGDIKLLKYIGDIEHFLNSNSYMIELNDGNYLATYTDYAKLIDVGWGINATPNEDCTLWFLKLNSNGETLSTSNIRQYLSWVLPFFVPESEQCFRTTGISRANDGDILISGYHSNRHQRGFLLKIGQENLVPKWIRCYEIDKENYSTPSNKCIPGKAYQLTDGSFAFHGCFHSFPSVIYPNGMTGALLIKTDKFGCLEPGCQEHDGVEEFDLTS
ncbi:MAG: hypothetical protein GX587_16510, partial [Bacteroidales bacterium]|nr:hypothetical protein [Bacteroidales bacterium]